MKMFILLVILIINFMQCSTIPDTYDKNTYVLDSMIFDNGSSKLINVKEAMMVYVPQNLYTKSSSLPIKSIGELNPKIMKEDETLYSTKFKDLKVEFYLNNKISNTLITRDNIDKIIVTSSMTSEKFTYKDGSEIIGKANVDGVVIDTIYGAFVAYKAYEQKDTVYWKISIPQEARNFTLNDIKVLSDIYTIQQRITKCHDTKYNIEVVGNYMAGVQQNILEIQYMSSGSWHQVNDDFLWNMKRAGLVGNLNQKIIIEDYYKSNRLFKHYTNGYVENNGTILKLAKYGPYGLIHRGHITYKFIRAFDENRAIYQDTNYGSFIAIDISSNNPYDSSVEKQGGEFPFIHIAPPYGHLEVMGPVDTPVASSSIVKMSIIGAGNLLSGGWIIALGHVVSGLVTGIGSEGIAVNNSITLSSHSYSTAGFSETVYDWEHPTLVPWGRIMVKSQCSYCTYGRTIEHQHL